VSTVYAYAVVVITFRGAFRKTCYLAFFDSEKNNEQRKENKFIARGGVYRQCAVLHKCAVFRWSCAVLFVQLNLH